MIELQDSLSQALHGKSSISLTRTRIQPMSETNVGANLMFAIRIKIINEPMSETHTFVTEHIGLIPVIVWRANIRLHKARPYIGFGHWLEFGFGLI